MRYFRIFDDYELEASFTRETVEGRYRVDVSENAAWPHFMTGGALLVSGAFLRALESAGVTPCEAEPVSLVDARTGHARDGYFELKVLASRQAADLRGSTFDVLMEGSDDGTIPPTLAFTEVVLEAGRVGGSKMFRLAEDPTVLVIDETVRDALVAHRPAEGWGVILEELEAR